MLPPAQPAHRRRLACVAGAFRSSSSALRSGPSASPAASARPPAAAVMLAVPERQTIARRIKVVVSTWVDSPEAYARLADDYAKVADFHFLCDAPPEDLLREVVDADCCVGIPSPTVFTAAKQLRWVHQPASGVNMAEGHPLITSDVALTNCPDAHVPPMAEWALAMMLCWGVRMEEHLNNQRNKVWAPSEFERPAEGYWGNTTVAGSTVGIIGATGGLGEAIAARVLACGATVYGVARTARAVSPIPGVESPIWAFNDVEKLLPLVDWLVVTCPLTPETTALIGAEQLALMKLSARVIVLSRGSIVEERALIAALEGEF